ncbi:MAG: endonuclease/exonuclease/phosphatase family protein [Nitrospinota bacterium]|nr:endonuclease/exonuclease/phosphatase family protein [Nitrospinota bacterium]
MPTYYIAWWNVENLFDVANTGGPDRPEHLQKSLKSELKGWTQAVLNKKLKQLASVIERMNDGLGPDILGVCEIENQRVLDQLILTLNVPARDYKVAHQNTKDMRGIDIAFIYDGRKFKTDKIFSHEVIKRSSTRDLFQVNFLTKSGNNDLIVVGNHWPSRMSGQYETEPYRIVAGETLAYWNLRIHENKGRDVPILVMGDFNDEPFHRSMTDYALSTRSRKKVSSSTVAPRLLNLMWPLMDTPSYYHNNFPSMLDQFLVSKGFLAKSGAFSVVDQSVTVIQFDDMVKGKFKVPRRFGRPSKSGFDDEGFSDHFPIALKIKEKEN